MEYKNVQKLEYKDVQKVEYKNMRKSIENKGKSSAKQREIWYNKYRG